MIGSILLTCLLAPLMYYGYRVLSYWRKLYTDGTMSSLDAISGLTGAKSKYFWLLGDLASLKEAATHSYRLFNRNSRAVGELRNYFIWIFWTPAIIVENPDDMTYLLTSGGKYFGKSYTYETLYGWWMSGSLLMVEGDMHSKQRKVFNNAFHFDHVKSMDDILVQKTHILLDILHKHDGSAIDINPHYANLTQDVLGKIGFNYEFNCQIQQNNECRQLLLNCLRASRIRQYKMFPWQFKKEIQLGDDSYNQLTDMINTVISSREKSGVPADARDILAQAMKARQTGDSSQYLSDKQFIANMHIFLFAGSDTTSAWLTCATWFLATHPDIQTKLQTELDGVDLKSVDVMKLVYLQAVLRESLRIYPSGPAMGRQAIKPVTLPSGLKVDHNMICICDIYSIHHSRILWGDDVEEFKPERWLDTAGTALTTHPHAKSSKHNLSTVYLPFIAGSRNCIGQNLARLEASVVLASLFKAFHFKLADDANFSVAQESTLAFPAGLKVITTKRHSTAQVNG